MQGGCSHREWRVEDIKKLHLNKGFQFLFIGFCLMPGISHFISALSFKVGSVNPSNSLKSLKLVSQLVTGTDCRGFCNKMVCRRAPSWQQWTLQLASEGRECSDPYFFVSPRAEVRSHGDVYFPSSFALFGCQWTRFPVIFH